MSNTIGATLDLSSLIRRVDNVADATVRIENQINQTNGRLNQVTEEITSLNKELVALKTSFDKYMDESKRATTLQKAATELIRVRQELEQQFGGYKIVRETMLGVLQATDLALVKKTTISQVTEELMLSTPDYWLAPCLVAVAAWIGNDRDLATRAITEAVKRDEEKTALTMALICRRNNRTDTCYEWLSLYFAKQSAENFTESNFTYLNAYLNGVFGPDNKHMCEDYVNKWMYEIQGNGEEFMKEQTELWKKYCEDFTVNLENQFPQMRGNVREYCDIMPYISRINSVGNISNNFTDITNVAVDEEKLKKDIDQTLVSLISRCDEKEEPLRKEEKYLQAIRHFDGDLEAAKQSVLEADRKRTEETINLVGQMTNILTKRKDARPSERKTSVRFLSGYIRNGFNQYISESKTKFPQQINFEIDSWSGTSLDGTNGYTLHQNYEAHMQREKQQAINNTLAKTPPAKMSVLTILLCIVTCGLYYFIYQNKIKNEKAAIQQQIITIDATYNQKIFDGHKKIDAILEEWQQAKKIVAGFEQNGPDHVA